MCQQFRLEILPFPTAVQSCVFSPCARMNELACLVHSQLLFSEYVPHLLPTHYNKFHDVAWRNTFDRSRAEKVRKTMHAIRVEV